MRRLRDHVRPKHRASIPGGSGPGTPPSHAGVAIYEVRGRLLILTVDGSSGAGIERDEMTVIDGYPDVDSESIGTAVLEATERAKEVTWPRPHRTLSEYAAPLLAASPGTFRSHRAWQRAARFVGGSRRHDGWTFMRWWPDLGRGGWEAADGRYGGLTEVELPLDAGPSAIGEAVLALLVEPSIAGP